MASKNTYKITVKFKKKLSNLAIRGSFVSGYKGGQDNDEFFFETDSFTIVAKRNAVYQDGSVLSSSRNGIYEQIMKGLLVYYPFTRRFPEIESVEIKRGVRVIHDYPQESVGIKPPIAKTGLNGDPLNAQISRIALGSNAKGDAVRISLAHWMIAITTDSKTERFEEFWRAFEQLGQFLSQSTKESESLSKLAEFMRNHEAGFAQSKAIAQSYLDNSDTDYDWFKFVYHQSKDFSFSQNGNSQVAKSNNFLKIVKNYEDKTVLNKYDFVVEKSRKAKRLLSVALQGQPVSFLDEFRSYVANHRLSERPIDRLVLLSTGYAYYFRCKLMHGEMSPLPFKLKETNEDRVTNQLIDLLRNVIKELLVLI